MTTTYEWDIEEFDYDPAAEDPQAGDIIEHSFAEHLAEFSADDLKAALQCAGKRLVLVRNVGNDLDGITDRLWAYVVDGKLPEFFNAAGPLTSIAVPKRYIAELASVSA